MEGKSARSAPCLLSLPTTPTHPAAALLSVRHPPSPTSPSPLRSPTTLPTGHLRWPPPITAILSLLPLAAADLIIAHPLDYPTAAPSTFWTNNNLSLKHSFTYMDGSMVRPNILCSDSPWIATPSLQASSPTPTDQHPSPATLLPALAHCHGASHRICPSSSPNHRRSSPPSPLPSVMLPTTSAAIPADRVRHAREALLPPLPSPAIAGSPFSGPSVAGSSPSGPSVTGPPSAGPSRSCFLLRRRPPRKAFRRSPPPFRSSKSSREDQHQIGPSEVVPRPCLVRRSPAPSLVFSDTVRPLVSSFDRASLPAVPSTANARPKPSAPSQFPSAVNLHKMPTPLLQRPPS